MITLRDITNATMWIDGVDIAQYGVLVESYKTSGTPLVNEIYMGRLRTSYNVLSSVFTRKEISVRLFFTGKTRRQITLAKSQIDSMLFGKVELYMPDGFYYTATCETLGELQTMGQQENQVIAVGEYKFLGIQHDALVTETGNTIYCRSTMPYTDCKLTCTASQAYNSLTIDTVTITGVARGDVLVVDGINGRILQNGAPCAGNMSFLRFPKLARGENTIVCPETLTIEYYPTYM